MQTENWKTAHQPSIPDRKQVIAATAENHVFIATDLARTIGMAVTQTSLG